MKPCLFLSQWRFWPRTKLNIARKAKLWCQDLSLSFPRITHPTPCQANGDILMSVATNLLLLTLRTTTPCYRKPRHGELLSCKDRELAPSCLLWNEDNLSRHQLDDLLWTHVLPDDPIGAQRVVWPRLYSVMRDQELQRGLRTDQTDKLNICRRLPAVATNVP